MAYIVMAYVSVTCCDHPLSVWEHARAHGYAGGARWGPSARDRGDWPAERARGQEDTAEGRTRA